MEIQGLNKFIRTLNNASNNFDEEAKKSLNKVSQKLIAKVKLKTPVSTGIPSGYITFLSSESAFIIC